LHENYFYFTIGKYNEMTKIIHILLYLKLF